MARCLSILLAFLFASASVAEAQKHDLTRCEALVAEIDTLHAHNHYHEAEGLVEELDSLSNRLNNSYFMAFSSYFNGITAIWEINFLKALQHILDAKSVAEELPDNLKNKILRIRIDIALGTVYINQRRFPQAYQTLLEGIEINKDVGNSKLQFYLENNLLVIYRGLDQYREIIAISKKMLSNPDYKDYNKYYLHYGVAACYTDLRIYDSASLYLDTALFYARTPYELAVIPYYRSALNIEHGNYHEALSCLDESWTVIDSTNENDVKASILINKGLTYLMLQEFESALLRVDEGIAIAQDNGFLYLVKRGLGIKRDILAKTDKYKEYVDVSELYNQISDSLDATENVVKLQQLDLEHQFELTMSQMAQEQLVKDMQQQRHRLTLYLVIILLAFGIVTTALLLNRNKILLKNKQMQEEAMARELDLRNRELTAKALVQSQRQEILNDIIEKLMAVQNDKKKMSDNLQSIINDFKQYRNAQTPEDFDYYFTQTHTDFYRNLSRDFPDLTPYETHLCAYIRLNLNTKDIAEICGIEPSSVRMARHRLRKSLGITDSDTNLIKFLSKY